MDAEQIINNARGIHGKIANSVWPNGWDMTCRECGRVIHLTTEECGYCLRHGWPKCCGKSMVNYKE